MLKTSCIEIDDVATKSELIAKNEESFSKSKIIIELLSKAIMDDSIRNGYKELYKDISWLEEEKNNLDNK